MASRTDRLSCEEIVTVFLTFDVRKKLDEEITEEQEEEGKKEDEQKTEGEAEARTVTATTRTETNFSGSAPRVLRSSKESQKYTDHRLIVVIFHFKFSELVPRQKKNCVRWPWLRFWVKARMWTSLHFWFGKVSGSCGHVV